VAGRTLFKHFRDYNGTSPMRYLRDARLNRVREALARADVAQKRPRWTFAEARPIG
jgi:transcriptional regulator GlxA family with amidase domain